MRLSQFIQRNMEQILQEWEAFAATLLPAAADMTPLALRNDADRILSAIAQDIATPQTREEHAEKSKGRAPSAAQIRETAAQAHAVLRAQRGFDINQLIAEYRALRASVLRLWFDAYPTERDREDEIIRFNEAIDQAVAESVSHFHAEMERARHLFLGMLGHDMRNPLDAIVITASYLASIDAGEQVSAAATRLVRSGESMRGLLDDLVDLSRTQLGVGIRVTPSEIDLAASVAEELETLRAVYSHRNIVLTVTGDCRGQWDGARVRQILRNLVSNAVQYGASDAPVRVVLAGDAAADVSLEVSNRESGVAAPLLRTLMANPLQRGLTQVGHGDRPDGLGLGLFIVQEVTDAHGGQIEVRRESGETTFAVRLPRVRSR